MTSILDKQFESTPAWWPRAVNQSYGNEVARAQGLEAARASIERRVRSYQGLQVSRGNDMIADLTSANGRLSKLIDALNDLAERAESGEPDMDVLEWRGLDTAAFEHLNDRALTPERVEVLATAIEDPLTALGAMEDRMPVLRVRPFSS